MARGRAAARCLIALGLCGAAVAVLAQPAASDAAASAPASAPERALSAASAPEPASAPSTALPSYALDPTHTFVHWELLHMNTSTIRGRFDKSSGNVQFDAKAQRIDVSIVIDTNSINTGTPVFDAMIRGSAMLNVAANPQAFFTARSARFEGEVPREIRGEFTLRGVSQPLSLRALRWHCGLSPVFARQVCGGDFEAQFDRSSVGITHSLPFVADRVRLLIQVEGIAR